MRGLGVGINLSKSVVSNPGLVVEYAKRTSLKGQDVSAISLKMLMAATDLKIKAQVALFLGLKTTTGITNYFKCLYSFGPSHLYRLKDTFYALANAEARIILRLLDKGYENIMSVLSLFAAPDHYQSWLVNDGRAMRLGQAKRLVDDLVKGRDIYLPPVPDAETYHIVLRKALQTKVRESAGKVGQYISMSFAPLA